MIERVHVRLCDWADEALGGYGGFESACVLGSLVDGSVAMTRNSKGARRTIRHDGEGNIVSLRAGAVTAAGTETRVAPQRQVRIAAASMEVSEALAKLPEHLRAVVITFYVRGDLQARLKAEHMDVSVKTMYRRLDAAHVVLDSLLYGVDLPRVCGSYPQASGQN